MPTTSGILVLLIKATIILVAAVGVTRVMQRASAGARHLVWLVTLGMLLVAPALAVWAPLHIPVVTRLRPMRLASALEGIRLPATAHPVQAPALGPSTMPVSETPRVIDQRLLVVAVWGGVLLLIVGSLAGSGLAVRRIVRRATPLDGQGWVAPLLEIADRMGLHAPPRLLVSRETKMPFACGVFAPTIVLPTESEAWSHARRQAVLLHELAHVRRKDLLGHMLGRLVCAAYWFHPLAWVAAARLRSESERACDDLALACGTRATDYAEHLLDIVTTVRRDVTPRVALAMARRKEFEGRMLAILDPDLRRSGPSRRQSLALTGSLALIACLVAAATPVARRVGPSPLFAAPASSAPVVVAPTVAMAAPESIMVHTHVRVYATVHQRPSADPGGDNRPELLAKVLRGDSSASLRRIAAWGLAQHTDSPAGVEALATALAHDRDADVRDMSAWALAQAGEDAPGAAAALATAVRHDPDPQVRGTAVWALGVSGAGAALDALTAALADTSARVRSRAAWAIGIASPPHAPPLLTRMLTDRDPQVRELAAWALYQIRDPASLPALEAALHTEQNEDNQLADIRALGEMGEASVTALRGLLESSDPGIKSMAVRALAGGHAAGPWPWPWPEPRPTP
jgi:beta-lactamase regulating signal transducer with metallopeptidase domain/HEAT repeat protein